MQRCYGCMKEFNKEYDVCPYCGYVVGTEPEIKSHLIPGTKLADRYVLGKAIGHGGFGITYIAWDEKIQKTVAIKEFFPNAFSSRNTGETHVSCYNTKSEEFLKQGIQKMLDEAKRLSKFSRNENIVDIFDFFEENNTAYIVIEYLEGKDLKKYLEECGGKLDPEEAVDIILPVINALEDMHKENLIHRDISPDNIFLCDNGKIKLLDFGSARLAVEDSDKSLSVMVKKGYTPKEQYASRSKQGPWTDVYAVSATLYRMITGELPVESTIRDEEDLKSFSEFGIVGYDELEKVVSKGLEFEHTKRTQSASELKNGLNKAVGNVCEYNEEPSEPSIKLQKEKKKIKANVIIAAVAVVVLVVAAIFAVKVVQKKQKEVAETTTTSATVTTTVTETTTSVAEETTEYKASDEVVATAIKAYENELAKCHGLFSAYVFDINKDNIPEVIYNPGELGAQFMMTYTEKSGLCVIDLIGHSSTVPEVYISQENCIYMRDDGHNRGTAFYHYAAIYEIDETGFVKVGEVKGEDPTAEYNMEDEEFFNKMVTLYDGYFEDKLKAATEGKTFKVYSNVAETQDPVAYLNAALSIRLSVVEAFSVGSDGVTRFYNEEFYKEHLAEEIFNVYQNGIYISETETIYYSPKYSSDTSSFKYSGVKDADEYELADDVLWLGFDTGNGYFVWYPIELSDTFIDGYTRFKSEKENGINMDTSTALEINSPSTSFFKTWFNERGKKYPTTFLVEDEYIWLCFVMDDGETYGWYKVSIY